MVALDAAAGLQLLLRLGSLASDLPKPSGDLWGRRSQIASLMVEKPPEEIPAKKGLEGACIWSFGRNVTPGSERPRSLLSGKRPAVHRGAARQIRARKVL